MRGLPQSLSKLPNNITMINWKTSCITAGLLLSLLSSQADTLVLTDGSRIEGELVQIHKGKYHYKTAFAGDPLEIPQEQVVRLVSSDPIVLRTESGEIFEGPAASETEGEVTVRSSSGTVVTPLETIAAGWMPGDPDPIVEDQLRKWAFSVGAGVSGKSGNSENTSISMSANAVLEGPHDRLNIYGSYNYQETDGSRSEDEQIGGMKYTNFFTERLGWYLREELEHDTIEGIDFRSTSAGGLEYKFIDEDRLTLDGNAGLSYRYESYTDPLVEDNGFAGLDFGLNLMWQFADWGKLNTKLTYTPSIDDFGNYLFTHESTVNFPLGTSDFWIMSLGLTNQYNSEPSPGRDELDTTYFARLILSWK